MKRIVVLFATILAFVASAFAAEPENQAATFNEITYDFGTFPEGKGKVTHVFQFKNDTKGPIILQDVKASCGCTTPKWTKTPVLPGKTGEVEVTYNAKGRPGAFSKTITVTSNQGVTRLMIKGEVELAKENKADQVGTLAD